MTFSACGTDDSLEITKPDQVMVVITVAEILAAEILEVIQVEALEAASLEIILQEYLLTRLTKI